MGKLDQRFVCPPHPGTSSRNRSTRHWLLAALLQLAVLAEPGCGPAAPKRTLGRLPLITSEDPRAEAELREARELRDSGNTEEAATRYEAFVAMRPHDPLVPIAKLELGRIRLDSGDLDAALALFEPVADHPDPALAEHARFNLGLGLYAAQEHAAAVRLLSPFVGRTIAPDDTARLLHALPDALVQLGRHVEALATLDRMADEPVSEHARERADARLTEIAERGASPEQIQVAYEQLPRKGRAWRNVAARALRDWDRAGEIERVRSILQALDREGVELTDEQQAIMLRATQRQDVDTRAVGVILTLSGRARVLGQLALHGVMLAAGLPPDGPPQADAPLIIFRDDAADPDQAAHAVEELVSVHRVVAIIGPIDPRAASAAAKRAQALGVPMVTLTHTGRVTEAGPMIFRLFTTPAAETHQLVRAAFGQGLRRFAVLHPANAYGRAMTEAYQAAVDAVGAQFVTGSAYEPGATSFGPTIRSLRKHEFDALFVPDTSRQLALIAPALAAADLWSIPPGGQAPAQAAGLQLLAPSIAFSHELVRSTSRYLQGALFSKPFDAATAGGPTAVFVERFQSQFGTAPNAFAAYAHDAFTLIQAAVKAGARSRATVAGTLPNLQPSQLAGPSVGLGPDREPIRATRLLRLQGRTFTPVSH